LYLPERLEEPIGGHLLRLVQGLCPATGIVIHGANRLYADDLSATLFFVTPRRVDNGKDGTIITL
jgi:hypothetical protein